MQSERSTVQMIESLVRAVEEQYVFPSIGEAVANTIRARVSHGVYGDVTGGAELATALTRDMFDVSHDHHLALFFSPDPLPTGGGAPPAAEIREVRRAFASLFNAGFHRVERLPGNAGYLDLRVFEDPEFAVEKAAAAMTLLRDTLSIIVDLRRNDGGHPHTVAVLCSYFLNAKPTQLTGVYWRVFDDVEEVWTVAELLGPRYLDNPVYLLTSRQTFSAAEQFAYDLKHLGRATLVGEPTRGGAHRVAEVPVQDHFVVAIPNGRAVNPITQTNWEGSGAPPDIEVPADRALEVAHVMALRAALETVDETAGRAHRELAKETRSTLQALGNSGAEHESLQ